MTRHLLVTNDFPPKIGGIQSYLWELWRRLPPEDVTVLTSPHPDDDLFDRRQPFRIVRTREPVLLPNPVLIRRVRRLAAEVGAEAVVLDPALPLGSDRPSTGPAVRGRTARFGGHRPGPPSRHAGTLLARVLAPRSLAHRRRRLSRGRGPPASPARCRRWPRSPRAWTRRGSSRWPPSSGPAPGPASDLPVAGPLVLSVSRLVPRKGMDTLIEAAARLSATGRTRS